MYVSMKTLLLLRKEQQNGEWNSCCTDRINLYFNTNVHVLLCFLFETLCLSLVNHFWSSWEKKRPVSIVPFSFSPLTLCFSFITSFTNVLLTFRPFPVLSVLSCFSWQAYARSKTIQACSAGGPAQEASPPSRERQTWNPPTKEAWQASHSLAKPEVSYLSVQESVSSWLIFFSLHWLFLAVTHIYCMVIVCLL